MKLIHGMKCPDCGTRVDVEFTVVDASKQTADDGMVSMTAVQSGPMTCECGFTYAPSHYRLAGQG